MGPVEQRDPEGERGLEHQELGGDGAGLAEEDPGRVEAGQTQPVPGGIGRLDRVAALNGKHVESRTATQNSPAEAGREDLPVGPEREAEQEQDRDGERADLVQADPGTDLDAEILSGDERGVTQHGAGAR